jgi:CDP-diacylglycerol--glycerol-3-phosphate 3-phosphatidyltransferase
MLKHLPNVLTLARLVLAPVIAYALWRGWAVEAAVMFIIAALTDLFDGMAARAFNAHSRFGRIIDPIADKALVILPLVVIAIAAGQAQQPLWPLIALATAIIAVRDIGITTWRFLSPDGEGVRVSQLAKWKTGIELIAVALGVLLAAAPALAIAAPPVSQTLWACFLALAAALSAWTGIQYIKAR